MVTAPAIRLLSFQLILYFFLFSEYFFVLNFQYFCEISSYRLVNCVLLFLYAGVTFSVISSAMKDLASVVWGISRFLQVFLSTFVPLYGVLRVRSNSVRAVAFYGRVNDAVDLYTSFLSTMNSNVLVRHYAHRFSIRYVRYHCFARSITSVGNAMSQVMLDLRFI